MLQITPNKKKIMGLFFDSPLENFYLRGISRETGIAITSVKRYIDELIRDSLIIEVKKGIYPSYKANRDDDNGIFRFYKKLDILERLHFSGLLEQIDDKCSPLCIILFGSALRGEDIETSDIDLFVQSKEVEIDISKFEKLFHREINLFFEKNFSRLSKELRSNLINGVILKGYLNVF
ncbi:MAG: nucleotidyltransferase domain-containing protein [Nanoarchaeota archaeon]|nr:nucleotidyltransferase domain-containing protein [Nanoarchaeota archaeon]